MSYDMRSWKQRSLEVASRSTTALRGQLAQRDLKINRRELQPGERGYAAGNPSQKQSWGQWVGEKVAATIGQGGDPNLGVDEITMFPGWAARRYVQPGEGDIESSKRIFFSVKLAGLIVVCRLIRHRGFHLWLCFKSPTTRGCYSFSACVYASRKRFG